MGMIEDIMKALDRIPGWKRINGLPAELDALRARVEALEKLNTGPAGQECPACGARSLRRTGSTPDAVFGDAGVMRDQYQCSAGGHQEPRMRDTMS